MKFGESISKGLSTNDGGMTDVFVRFHFLTKCSISGVIPAILFVIPGRGLLSALK